MAEREMGETAEVRTAKLAELRARLETLEKEGIGTKKKHRKIVFPRKDDQFLICFLRSRKFRVADAEKVLINYTEWVHAHADVGAASTPPVAWLHICVSEIMCARRSWAVSTHATQY